MDAYTIGIVILALALINKIMELPLAITSVVVVAGVIVLIGGKKK